MARRPKPAEESSVRDALDKIACLLAILVTKEMKQDDASMMLDAIGFDDKDITAALGVSSGYVRLVRFKRKKKRKGR